MKAEMPLENLTRSLGVSAREKGIRLGRKEKYIHATFRHRGMPNLSAKFTTALKCSLQTENNSFRI